jgi:hypothetical protein
LIHHISNKPQVGDGERDIYRGEQDVRQEWDRGEDAVYRGEQDVRRDWDRGEQEVRDAPDEAAGWAGRKVGDAERDVRDVGEGIGGFVSGVAGWIGSEVSGAVRGVENFDDGVRNSYDTGKEEGRDGW